mgnify:CR=1 FL=1
MALESSGDYSSYLNTKGIGVTATFFEAQNTLWDTRTSLIDTWYDIDSGNSTNINLIFDEQYFLIDEGSTGISSVQPVAYVKYSDAQYISHNDRIIVNAITTNKGTVLKAETTYLVKRVENEFTGIIRLILEKQ